MAFPVVELPVVELAVILSMVLLAIPAVVAIAGRDASAIILVAMSGAMSILIIAFAPLAEVVLDSEKAQELKLGLMFFLFFLWISISIGSIYVSEENDMEGMETSRVVFSLFMMIIALVVPSMEKLAIIAIFVLTIAVIIRGIFPHFSIRGIFPPSPSRFKILPSSVCEVFCNAWKKVAQLASYTEGSSAVNEEMRKNFIALLSQALGELKSVKPELSRERARELDSILRELEKIIETLKHRDITTDIYIKMSYISSRLKILGDRLGCRCS
jgi:hypothetical protein